MKTTGSIGDYVTYMGNDIERQKIMGKGKAEGKERASGEYPYAVERNTASLQRIAEQITQEWYDGVTSHNKDYKGNWSTFNPKDRERITQWVNKAQEIKRLFTAAWVAGYQETVAAKDEAAKPKPTPQPQPQPQPQQHRPDHATPSNAAKLHGATITLKYVDHSNPDECVYLLEVRDPQYMDEPYEQEWVIPLVDDTTGYTPMPSAESAGGYVSAGSDAYYSKRDSQSQTQRPRKPGSGYFRKP